MKLLFIAITLFGSLTSASKAVISGTFQPACAPWDGPGLRFDFKRTKAKYPVFWIGLWNRTTLKEGDIFAIRAGTPESVAKLCTDEQHCHKASSGTLKILEYTKEKNARGAVKLMFLDQPTNE